MIKKLKKSMIMLVVFVFWAVVLLSSFSAGALSANDVPKGTPTIDGKIDTIWANASKKIDINISWSGDEKENASGYARLLWDSKNLYVLGSVIDKTVSTKVPTGADIWNTDGFEIVFDQENKHVHNDKVVDQFRIIRSGNLSGMIQHVIADDAAITKAYPGMKWACLKTSDGYNVEYAIPWTRVTPKENSTRFGIEFKLNDDYDNEGFVRDAEIGSIIEDLIWWPSSYRVMKLSSESADKPASSEKNNSKPESSEKDTTSGNKKTDTESNKQSTVNSNVDDGNVTDANDNTVSDDQVSENEEQANGNQKIITETVESENDYTAVWLTAIIVSAVVLIFGAACLIIVIKINKKL